MTMNAQDLLEIFAPAGHIVHPDGEHTALSFDAYCKDVTAVGSSHLRAIMETEAHYKAEVLDGDLEDDESITADLGSAIHCLILEEGEFADRYEVAPKEVERRAGKEYMESRERAIFRGRKLLLQKDLRHLEKMRDSLHAHPIARAMLSQGKYEHTYFITDPHTGLRKKARPDLVAPHPELKGKLCHVDLKSTALRSIAIQPWANHEFRMGRHIQAFWHKDVFEQVMGEPGLVEECYHVVVMQKPPYLVRIMRIPPEWIELGRLDANEGTRRLLEALEAGEFKGYPDDEILDLPVPSFVQHGFESF